jgi:capsular polysaccharide biosynthesis protein
MENEKFTENEINILDLIFVIRKNWIKIAVAAVVCACIFLAYTLTLVTPMYRSATQLLIKGISSEAMSIYPDSTSRIMLVNNSIEVLSGTEVMQSVIDELGLKIMPEQLQSMVSISSPVDTQVLKISVTCADPELACKIAREFADISHSVLAENVGVSALSTIQVAKTPISPISPNIPKNVVMGGFVGAFLAAAFYILMWFVNNRIITPSDAERALGLTLFSSIPLAEREPVEDGKAKSDKE